jgi:hypothetical protein
LQHNLSILEAGLARERKKWSWEYTPTCVRILNGSLSVIPTEQVEPLFFASFYDRAQAEQGIQIFRAVLEASPPPAPTGQWAEKDAQILREVIARI